MKEGHVTSCEYNLSVSALSICLWLRFRSTQGESGGKKRARAEALRCRGRVALHASCVHLACVLQALLEDAPFCFFAAMAQAAVLDVALPVLVQLVGDEDLLRMQQLTARFKLAPQLEAVARATALLRGMEGKKVSNYSYVVETLKGLEVDLPVLGSKALLSCCRTRAKVKKASLEFRLTGGPPQQCWLARIHRRTGCKDLEHDHGTFKRPQVACDGCSINALVQASNSLMRDFGLDDGGSLLSRFEAFVKQQLYVHDRVTTSPEQLVESFLAKNPALARLAPRAKRQRQDAAPDWLGLK